MLRIIEREELKDLMDSGENFALVNVLNSDEFERKHICGSLNIPFERIEEDAPRLINKDETVIVYCSGPACTASAEAGERLENMGYTDVWRFEGGMKEWGEAGFCLEGTELRPAA